MLSHFKAGVIKCILHDSTGEGSCKTVPDFLQISPCAFSFCDFALYLFAVVHLSCEYNYMESCQSSSNVEVSLGKLQDTGSKFPKLSIKIATTLGFPGSSAGKEPACNAGDPVLISGPGRSSGEGIGYPQQYS